MPEDQSQLRNLLSLLAELQQSSLPRTLIQQVGDEGHGSPILLRHVVRGDGGILIRLLLSLLLLSLLSLRLCLLLLGGLLLLLLATVLLNGLLLLMHPGRVGLRVKLMVPVHVRRVHHVRVCALHARTARLEIGALRDGRPRIERRGILCVERRSVRARMQGCEVEQGLKPRASKKDRRIKTDSMRVCSEKLTR